MKSAELKDKVLEHELRENGFVHINSFISPEEIDQILSIYKEHHPEGDKNDAMWNSLYNAGTENGLNISARIMNILKPRLDALFESYYAPVATFMSKNPNENSTCYLHRDYSTADETEFQYRNIWLPLVDTEIHNGALYVLKGSNKIFDYPLPMFREWPYISMQERLVKSALTVQCKAGDLVIYLDKTLHGSHVNHSADSRPVVHFGALHPDVQLLFYYLDQTQNKVRTYRVPFQFFFENDFSEPVGRYPLYSEFDFNPPAMTIDEIERKLAIYH